MDTFLNQRALWLSLFASAILLLVAAEVRAEKSQVANAAPVFAESGSLRSIFSGGGTRDRMVQICVLCMAAALFILLKKFAPDADRDCFCPSPPQRTPHAPREETTSRETR